MNAARGQVVSEAALLEALQARRAAGGRVVFTNGGFDLLHVGHVRMLAEAATLGDVLVVGVNDDASVRASKGPGRPLVPAAERAELVAAVAGVDFVVVFGDRTVDRLLRALRPDVHAKGRDYADATLPEAATNRAMGIATAYVGDAKGHATSDLVARLGAPVVPLDRAVSATYSSPPGAPGLKGEATGLALRGKARFLATHGLGDLASLLATSQGIEVLRHATRTVRRIEVSGEVVYAKVEREARRGPGALDEFRNHLALRAAGLRAPEPWLAFEGKGPDGRAARALVTKAARGTPLDVFLDERFATASARDRAAWARGIGVAVRALHTARFLHPDLLAYHLVVDGSPAGGPASLTFLDLARLDRARVRVTPKDAAPGLAALALSLRPRTTRRFRLAILRAYLGGSLGESRAWRDAIEKRIAKVKDRGTFRALGAAPAGERRVKDDDVLHADEATTAALAAAGIRSVRDVLAHAECIRDLKDRSNHVLRVGSATYHVKRTKGAKVSREAVAIEFLAALGVSTATLAFWGAARGVGAICGTVDLAPARPLDDLLRERALPPAAVDAALQALAAAAAAMHEARVHHRDLYLNHVFVDPTGVRPGVTIIDVERLQRHMGVLPGAIVKDLAAVEASIPEGTVELTTRVRLLVHYLRARRFPVRTLLGNLLRRVSKKVEQIRAHVPRTPVGVAARPRA